ncbi:SDR family NAD(P)-dependent oxidoreductase [bacterium]|nr:SDR family NAD(P)-dependent oxidoreductase [bacterium]
MKKNNRVVLVLGANRGIGLGIVKNLIKDKANFRIYASYRSEERSKELLTLAQQHSKQLKCIVFDAIQESDYRQLYENVASNSERIDLCINCIGILDDGTTFPERKIEDLSQASLMQAYLHNTVPTLLLAKHLKSLLFKSEQPKLIAVSAKVGSISDNRLGGWYSYRLSKTALNMAIKNISIEFKRRHQDSIVVAIHPGTTETDLSKPFIKNAAKKYIIHQPQQTGDHILKIIEGLSPNETGSFFSWDGSLIPW